MKDDKRQESDLRDEGEAAEERPIPSQAEGDLETIEEDLKQKGKQQWQGRASSGKEEGKR
ncbi:MAG: hypothetical protein ACJ74Z_00535 [Bryobacteraceae bacterium]